MTKTYDILASVVHYGAPETTEHCLASLSESETPVDVVVLSCSPDTFQANTIHIRNSGYGGNQNHAIECAMATGYEYILLLNNDTLIPRTLIGHLVEFLRLNAEFMAIAPTQILPDRRTVASGFKVNAQGSNPFVKTPMTPASQAIAECDVLAGPALLIRVAALRHVGGFDESFFHYYEDDDLTWRLRKHGFRLAVSGQYITHSLGHSLSSHSPIAAYYLTRNRILFYRKHFSAWRCLAPLVHEAIAIRTRIHIGHQMPNAKTIGVIHGLLNIRGQRRLLPRFDGGGAAPSPQ